MSRTIDVLKIGHVESSEFAWNIGAAGVHVLALFYGLKELTDVHDLSLSTKSLLFDYVLETKPEERSTAFFEEVGFILIIVYFRAALLLRLFDTHKLFNLVTESIVNKHKLYHQVLSFMTIYSISSKTPCLDFTNILFTRYKCK